jgi:hypothetical protein
MFVEFGIVLFWRVHGWAELSLKKGKCMIGTLRPSPLISFSTTLTEQTGVLSISSIDINLPIGELSYWFYH